jgi:outer membrane protein OmpA-like peptidoglycan-associated protein
LAKIDAQFQTAEYTLRKNYKANLDEMAKEMIADPAVKLKISGHADSRGDKAFNDPLSENRAKAVKKYLVSKGVSEDRITIEFFGDTVPKGDNSTVMGQAINRRCEFTLTK